MAGSGRDSVAAVRADARSAPGSGRTWGGGPVIKIRYAELPAGLHVAIGIKGSSTIIYLQPGLTPEQRQQALTLARRSARLGHAPRLPAFGLAAAVSADRARMTVRAAAGAVRKHPLAALPLLVLAAGLAAMLVMAAFGHTSPPPHRRPVPGSLLHQPSGARPCQLQIRLAADWRGSG